MKKLSRSLLITFSALTIVAVPAITLGVLFGGKSAPSTNQAFLAPGEPQPGGTIIPNGGDQTNTITPPVNASKEAPLTSSELLVMAQNGRDLRDSIRDDYQVLVPQAQSSAPYNDFVSWVKALPDSEVRDHKLITQRIANLDMSNDLKKLLLVNYLEREAIAESKASDKESVAPQIATDYTADQKTDPAAANTDKAPYRFDEIEVVRNLPSWDVGESKGMIDPISGDYYAKDLQVIQQTHSAGWYDDDADSGWQTDLVKIYFTDKTTGARDWIGLYYNAAQDTNEDNEDYAFAAMMPSSKANIMTVKDRTSGQEKRVPALFGLPLNFFDMTNFEAWQHNAYRGAPFAYIATFHEKDLGEDNEWGNYLDGVSFADKRAVPVLNGREGANGMLHIARDLIRYIYIMLNSPFTNELNENFLFMRTPDEKWVYLTDENGNWVPRHGYDRTDEDYHFFAPDETIFSWSNQKVLDVVTPSFYRKAIDNIKSNKHYIATDLVDIPINIFGEIIDFYLKDLSKTYRFSLKFMAGNLISTIISGVSQNWVFPEEAIGMTLVDGVLSFAIPRAGFVLASRIAENIAAKLASSVVQRVVSFAGPVGAVAAAILKLVVDIIPSGNGHTLAENFNDHGLNDWEFQWINNREVMNGISIEWSDRYKNGIEWKVVDSFFETPDLYIRNSNDGSVWEKLNHNQSFSWGNKIENVKRS